MNPRYKTLRFTELGLIIFVWLVLLLTPVLFKEDNNIPLLRSVLNQLEILIPLSILFILNRFILVPRLLFKRKPGFFILSVICIIVLLAFGSYIYDSKIKEYPPPREIETNNGSLLRPNSSSDNHGQLPLQNPPQGRQPRPIPPYANFLIFSVLIVGFDTGLRSGLRWLNVENEKVRLEKENVATQLTLLRSQVSPHFFMNTLNNIHALIDTNTIQAKELLDITLVDLMFVDINMPDLSGMELIKTLENPPFVVFVTAYSEYAIEGFRVDAIDYLLKPVSYADFLKSANKVKTWFEALQNKPAEVSSNKEFLFIKSEYKILRINFDDIKYIEAMSEYIRIHLINSKPVMTQVRMKSIEDKLPEDRFMRVHRSFIINLSKISVIERNRIIFDGNVYIPVSEQYKDNFQQYIDKNFLN